MEAHSCQCAGKTKTLNWNVSDSVNSQGSFICMMHRILLQVYIKARQMLHSKMQRWSMCFNILPDLWFKPLPQRDDGRQQVTGWNQPSAPLSPTVPPHPASLSLPLPPPTEKWGGPVMLRQLHLIAQIRSRHSQMWPRPGMCWCHHQRCSQGGLIRMSWGEQGWTCDVLSHFLWDSGDIIRLKVELDHLFGGGEMVHFDLWFWSVFIFQSQQAPQIMERSPECCSGIHPSKFHQNQRGERWSFEILTFN